MRRLLLLALAAAALAAGPPGPAQAARDEVWDVEEEVLAQMARTKVRKNTENKTRSAMKDAQAEAGAGGTAGGGCGNLNVGNVRGNRRGGDQQVTVIVTGNVINANNRCPR
jgi:hypothetical protein